MARHLFGLSPADVTVAQVGEDMKLRPGSVGTAWDALSGGTQLTDLTDLGGTPATTVTSDANSVIGFYGPDGVSTLYLDFGAPSRVVMQASDLGTAITALQVDKLDKAGGTMIGPLVLDADPATALGAATKQYADNKFLPLTGGTVSGDLAVTGTTSSPTLQGGTASGANLTLNSTSNATKGKILLGANSAYDEVNKRLGINTTSPTQMVEVKDGSVYVSTSSAVDPAFATLSNSGLAFTGSGGSVSGLTSVSGLAGSLNVSGSLAVSGGLTVTGVGQVQFVRKTSDQSKTSTTTLGNDTQLLLPVVANATYSLFLLCIFSGGTTGDIKFDWTVPSGTVLRWADQTGASGLNTDVDVYSAPGGTTQVAFQVWATVVTSSTAGNVQFRWAQNATDATATIVRTNSMLQLTRAA
ncbi:hypothetical protein OG824_04290 [Streptomyces prunicolor]|uniref:hypothetical protein n=1 Tax=Streptomyces prunicolor TaxID=67348 RepID=UPI00224CC12B|nr:hypothetical protein [Streptomyces prunicolor]MCX5234453.1 hypothetical protein [Streptomyces prunicolor]